MSLSPILTKPLISHYENQFVLLPNMDANIQKSGIIFRLKIGYYLKDFLCLMIPIKDLRKPIFQRFFAEIIENDRF